ncbi:MAG: tetratricopeptide repeat protein, partial [Limisphaerales bacterium]
MSKPTLSGNPDPARSCRAMPFFLCLLLVAVTLAVYWPVIHCESLNYDDPDYFTSNVHVQAGLTLPGVIWAFTTGHASNWHPLTWLSLMLDVDLFGKGPAGPHFTNLLFHLANTVLLFLLLRQMTSAPWRSAMVAALFALHPVHVESVAWISERKDVLSAFFGLLALWFYAGYARRVAGDQWPAFAPPDSSPVTRHPSRFYWLALVFFACGLMSKPMLVTLPFVMLLLDWWPLQRVTGDQWQVPGILRLFREKWPFFVLSAISCGVTFIVQQAGGAVTPLARVPLAERLGNVFVSYARYLELTFRPEPLAVIYPYPGHWSIRLVLCSAALFMGLGIVAVCWRRKHPFATVGWFWFAGMLVPVIGLVQVGVQAMADRYTYLPLTGLFILLVWGVGAIGRVLKVPNPPMFFLAVIILAACAWRTRGQLGYWRDNETLFRHTIAVTKENYVALNNLGSSLSRQGRLGEATNYYLESLRINPDNPDVLYNWGNAMTRLGRLDEAIGSYRHALQIDPKRDDALNNLGFALAAQKQFADAIECFEAALKLNPDYADAHNNLGTVLFMQHQFDGAVQHFREAVRLDPGNPQLYANLADALVKQAQIPEAVRCYQQ